MTKAARKDWEELRVGYRVKKDGFVKITGNRNKADGLSVETYGKNYWIKAGISSYHRGESIIPDPIDAENDPSIVSDSIDTSNLPSVSPDPIDTGNSLSVSPDSINIGNDPSVVPDSIDIGNDPSNPPQTQSVGQTCTAWYWVDGGGWTFIGITCEDNIDYGSGENGGQSGISAEQLCAECKRKAQAEHDNNLNFAKTTLYTAVIAGCHVAGAGTYISFNTAGWWVNLIPGIGPGAIQALSALGGIIVDISCLATSVSAYNAAEATIDNSYFKDISDCNEKYCH